MNTFVVSSDRQSSERFDPLKLHASIVDACMMVRAFEGEAHQAAQHVCKAVIDWLEPKTEVTTADLRRVAGEQLATYHPEAAYIYEQYQLMI